MVRYNFRRAHVSCKMAIHRLRARQPALALKSICRATLEAVDGCVDEAIYLGCVVCVHFWPDIEAPAVKEKPRDPFFDIKY
ncbi:hypothetical protein Tdes44962_MAKER02533 [Teratosphaeria destructans]|uniref:Uncharacterized protein n=1 Tax=Teratosphaeria destructans TaxID=418781 RepID=A0A9W7ST37_9PEZI|nr:hypothetical protein Tdes44962_MAKER02533 [Teratosphaeria destructans]